MTLLISLIGLNRAAVLQCILLVAVALISCSGSSGFTAPLAGNQLPGQPADPVDTQQPAAPVNSGTDPVDLLADMLTQPSRLASAAADEFLSEQLGADYAGDLPYQHCAQLSASARFTPSWSAASTGLGDAAFCIYRLQLNAQPVYNTLTFNWQNQPILGDCWVGLADWDADTWDWKQLTTNTELYLSDVSAYSGASQQCYAVILLMGNKAVELASISFSADSPGDLTYPIVDTDQTVSYDDGGNMISPAPGAAFYGQDAQYSNLHPAYQNNGDGTITDLNTGLMWAQTPNNLEKVTWDQAFTYADSLVLGGHEDWRVPSIKELYSLIIFSGVTGMSAFDSIPYIDDTVFDFEYGDESSGERHIDAQYWSSTEYVSTTMNGDATTFGVNFADGRIKGYGRSHPMGGEMEQFIRCVRGNPDYGVNSFADNGDGTITDNATGLIWMQQDSGFLGAGGGDGTLNWEQALDWAENLEYASQSDWRLPSAKELQSIVDYTRSPDTTSSAAIDPLFLCTTIIDEGSGTDYGFYWSSTSHLDGPPESRGNYAAYVAFGEALGFMEQPPGSSNYVLQDVHGAGAQRSDPKSGNPDDYPYGHGPQGDVIRIYNLVRCVRGGLAN